MVRLPLRDDCRRVVVLSRADGSSLFLPAEALAGTDDSESVERCLARWIPQARTPGTLFARPSLPDDLPLRQGLLLSLVALAAIPFTLFIVGTGALLIDPLPEGPACRYEIKPGSGPAGTGHEEIRWGIYPGKVCVGTYNEGDEFTVESNVDTPDFAPVWALAVGTVIWWGGRRRLLEANHARIAAPGLDGQLTSPRAGPAPSPPPPDGSGTTR